MAGLREIQNRRRSIQDTRKITGAMYMIASTKMKKAKRDLEKTEPYFYSLEAMIERVMRHMPEMETPFLEVPGKKRTRIGLLVITGDKGLAGAYNHNVLKLAQAFLDDPENQVSLYVVGEMGRSYFREDTSTSRKFSVYRAESQLRQGEVDHGRTAGAISGGQSG